MQRPLSANPMLQLLSLRAHAAMRPSMGALATSDPWVGLGNPVARAIGEGPNRRPGRWMEKWPPHAVRAFVEGLQAPVVRDRFLPTSHPQMEALVHAAHRAHKHPVAWGQWPDCLPGDGVLFGITPARDASVLPGGLRAAGLVVDPSDLGIGQADALERLASQPCQAWWVVPATRPAWQSLGPAHYRLAHRLGLSMWLDAPAQCDWGDYVDTLGRVAAALGKSTDWEQWVWPVCDLIEQSLREVIAAGRPRGTSQAPWKWEGRCRQPDWEAARIAVWQAVEAALGGAGAMDELLVASVLWHEKLLDAPVPAPRGLA